jgi:chromate transport protein ChrA
LAGAFYLKYKDLEMVKRGFSLIQLVVFAMIIAVAFQALPVRQLYSMRSLIVVAAAFILFTWTKIHPAFIILAAGALGVLGF